jgi:acetylglutamate kinase
VVVELALVAFQVSPHFQTGDRPTDEGSLEVVVRMFDFKNLDKVAKLSIMSCAAKGAEVSTE